MTPPLNRLRRTAVRRLSWAVRDLRPNRWVEREVAGVRMAMPWSHRLPDFVANDPVYGENLLQLAQQLAAQGPITVLDVGANIGDSTLLILDRVPDARVLAVEPDEVFLPFLRHNVGDDHRIVVEASLLTTDPAQQSFAATRIGGTAAFAPAAEGGVPTIPVARLREQHPDFASLRLVKSDTDGYDVTLVPEIARVWADARPVLFYEYDHRASLAASNEPMRLWQELADLGYTEVMIWDNGGHPLRRCTLSEAARHAERDAPASPAGFWDVAAAHAEDPAGIAVLDALSRSADG